MADCKKRDKFTRSWDSETESDTDSDTDSDTNSDTESETESDTDPQTQQDPKNMAAWKNKEEKDSWSSDTESSDTELQTQLGDPKNSAACKNKEEKSSWSFDTDSSDSEPQTQPAAPWNGDDLPESSEDEIWGWLHPTPNSKLKSFALKNNSYSFGRNPSCDYVFKEKELSEDTVFHSLSNIQFKITRQNIDENFLPVYLHDFSMNGTFVNKQKVGKGLNVLLTTNDEISLVHGNTRAFVFVDNTFTLQWMPKEMKNKFNLKGLLGSGSYGEVRMAVDKEKKKDVAIKKIKKRAGKEFLISNEIKIFQKLKHAFIVMFEDVFHSPDYVYIVLEYIPGGTLASKVRTLGNLNPDEAKHIFYQLAIALKYLHSEGIAHRDFKPDNVLLARCSDGDMVKVTDFGLSKLVSKEMDTDLRTNCGTPIYTAPEVLMTKYLGSYTHQVDIWSFGVSLFYCLCGKHPFHADRPEMSITEQIVRGSYTMKHPQWIKVGLDAIRLVMAMLVTDPDSRITISQILENKWFQDEAMKKKVERLMKNVSPPKQSRCMEYTRPSKRPRYESGADTLRKS